MATATAARGRQSAAAGVVELPVIQRLVEHGTLVIAAAVVGAPVYEDPMLGWKESTR